MAPFMDTAADYMDALRARIAPVLATEPPDQEGCRPSGVVLALAFASLQDAIELGDHTVARCVLAALLPVRAAADMRREMTLQSLGEGCLMCAAGLRFAGIRAAAVNLDQVIADLQVRLGLTDLSSIETWARNVLTSVQQSALDDEGSGWWVVEQMLRGESHAGACSKLADARRVVDEHLQHMEQSGPRSSVKALPFFGRMISTDDMVAISFGLGGGSAAMVNGKLSITLPSNKATWRSG